METNRIPIEVLDMITRKEKQSLLETLEQHYEVLKALSKGKQK